MKIDSRSRFAIKFYGETHKDELRNLLLKLFVEILIKLWFMAILVLLEHL